ncbi:MAG: ASKHA domain-containing protein [Lachnospiraceae bacterium]
MRKSAGSVKDVELTEADIDSFIRAKGAIFSAIRTMLSYCDFDIRHDRECLCGGWYRKRHQYGQCH